MLETEKKDAERQAVRLEKDKNALRNTLDKVRDTLINNLQPEQNISYNYLLAKAQLQETNSKLGFMWVPSSNSIFCQVERQKLMTEESSMRLSAAKGRLDRSLNTAEQELQEAQQQILMLQVGSGRKNQT